MWLQLVYNGRVECFNMANAIRISPKRDNEYRSTLEFLNGSQFIVEERCDRILAYLNPKDEQ